MIIEGAISVKSAIINRLREIEMVYIAKDKHTKDFNYLRRLMKDNSIPFKECERQDIDELASGKSHGGIIAFCGVRSYQQLKDLSDDIIFYIDGIEDPFNLGYMMRSLYAFGINNIMMPKRNLESLEKTILKSSAGAYDYLKIYLSDNTYDDLALLKNDYKIYALQRNDDSFDIYKEKFEGKMVVLVGGEKRGISHKILSLCDKYLYIPYGSNFRNALNASSALSVVASLIYERKNYD